MCSEGEKVMGPAVCLDSINSYSKETNQLQLAGVRQAAICTLIISSGTSTKYPSSTASVNITNYRFRKNTGDFRVLNFRYNI
jgi:hypothetical protein